MSVSVQIWDLVIKPLAGQILQTLKFYNFNLIQLHKTL